MIKVIGTEVYRAETREEAEAALKFLESKGYFGYIVYHPCRLGGINIRTLEREPMLPDEYQVFMFELTEMIQ